jgi:hypothetical protein
MPLSFAIVMIIVLGLGLVAALAFEVPGTGRLTRRGPDDDLMPDAVDDERPFLDELEPLEDAAGFEDEDLVADLPLEDDEELVAEEDEELVVALLDDLEGSGRRDEPEAPAAAERPPMTPAERRASIAELESELGIGARTREPILERDEREAPVEVPAPVPSPEPVTARAGARESVETGERAAGAQPAPSTPRARPRHSPFRWRPRADRIGASTPPQASPSSNGPADPAAPSGGRPAKGATPEAAPAVPGSGYDAETCARFAEPLGDDVLDRAIVLFEELSANGRADSPTICGRIGAEPRSIGGMLTARLKRRAVELELPPPYDARRAEGTTVWKDRDGIAPRMLAALRSERERRRIALTPD